MMAFIRWCAGLMIASIVLTLLVCGSMMGFSAAVMHDVRVQFICTDHTCAPMAQDCLLSCLSETDELEVRTLLSVVIVFVGAAAAIFVPALQFSSEFVRISAPPWRQHRLFAFRE